MPPSADAMWTDSTLGARPCAGNAKHYLRLLSYAIAPCIAVYSILRAARPVVCVHPLGLQTKHTPLSEALVQSGGMCRQCLAALVTHSPFHQSWRHSSRGTALRAPQPIVGRMGIPAEMVPLHQCPLRMHDITSRKDKSHWCLLATLSAKGYAIRVQHTRRIPGMNPCTELKPAGWRCHG